MQVQAAVAVRRPAAVRRPVGAPGRVPAQVVVPVERPAALALVQVVFASAERLAQT